MNSRSSSGHSGLPRFHATNLLRFGECLLVAAGLAEDRAGGVAEVLLEGDLLGHTTHGFALLPAYLKSLKDGSMEKQGEPVVAADHDSALTWDGRYLPGPWLVRCAIAEAQARATKHPVVTIVIHRSHHIGCLQAYLKPVADKGFMILLSCSDPANRTVTPHGGVAPRLSPNPLAVGIPTDDEPILIDISTSTTALAVCQRSATAGEQLPGMWLINRDGQPTNDPRELFDDRGGSLLPLGGLDLGYKGFALGLLVEALTNALGGHGRADNISRWALPSFCRSSTPTLLGGANRFYAKRVFWLDRAGKRQHLQKSRRYVCPARPLSHAVQRNLRTVSSCIRPSCRR